MSTTQSNQFCISGVIPSLTAKADIVPVRSETGIGALMPWANRLWFVTYVAHMKESGAGTGLFEVDNDFNIKKHSESVVGTYANRMIHAPTNQLVIGPHLIDIEGNVRTIKGVQEHRLTATMEHLHDPQNMIYFLTMEGLLFEVNVHTLETTQLFDLLNELYISEKAKPHFKGGFTLHGRVVVANNTYMEGDYLGTSADGRLAEWDGKKWTVLEKKAFNEVTGRKDRAAAILATGQDRASAILKVFVKGQWTTYRLPRASSAHDETCLTEWPRIREVETERYLMNASGMFYEMASIAYEGKVWGIRPVSTHLRMVPDFCSWRGLLVLGGNQVSPIWDKNIFVGEPQSNLWFGKTDDLWQFGKPTGWGGPWWENDVEAGIPSDPYLMTGFDKKCLHLSQDSDTAVDFTIEIDFLGNQSWKQYMVINVPAKGYAHHEFPAGFSAHWVRVTSNKDCKATAYFTYT